jgi:hypothetical protein
MCLFTGICTRPLLLYHTPPDRQSHKQQAAHHKGRARRPRWQGPPGHPHTTARTAHPAQGTVGNGSQRAAAKFVGVRSEIVPRARLNTLENKSFLHLKQQQTPPEPEGGHVRRGGGCFAAVPRAGVQAMKQGQKQHMQESSAANPGSHALRCSAP